MALIIQFHSPTIIKASVSFLLKHESSISVILDSKWRYSSRISHFSDIWRTEQVLIKQKLPQWYEIAKYTLNSSCFHIFLQSLDSVHSRTVSHFYAFMALIIQFHSPTIIKASVSFLSKHESSISVILDSKWRYSSRISHFSDIWRTEQVLIKQILA
jgi:hypothetical protein